MFGRKKKELANKIQNEFHINEAIIDKFADLIINNFIEFRLKTFELSKNPMIMFNPVICFSILDFAISLNGGYTYAKIDYVDFGLDCLNSKREKEQLGIEISKSIKKKFESFFGYQTLVQIDHNDYLSFQIQIHLENPTSRNNWSSQHSVLREHDYSISGRIKEKVGSYFTLIYNEIMNTLLENKVTNETIDLMKEKVMSFSNYIDTYKAFFDTTCQSYAKSCLLQLDSLVKSLECSLRAINSGLSNQALNLMDSLNGFEFEQWCAKLLSANGFNNVTITKGSGDQGVDIVAVKYDIKYAIQCKCYRERLGNKPVQEVHAGKKMYNCHVAVVMTNSYFTESARKLAKVTGVLLWDRDKIMSLLNSN